MAVTIAELLEAVRDHLDQRRAAGMDADAAADAAAGLAPVGRALDLLYNFRPYAYLGDETRPDEAAALSSACVDAARGWPGQGARVADLLGAAADVIGTHARTFSGEQRWALTEALAVNARRCVDAARQFTPYEQIPQLGAVRTAAVACERRSTVLPASAADRSALDCLVPGRHLTNSANERIVDAAAALHHAITGRGYYPQLCMAELLITVNAAHLATSHAAHEVPVTVAGAAAPVAWRAARVECSGFDDGTKLRPPESSAVAAAAARLGRNLLDQSGPAAYQPEAPASSGRCLDADGVATLQTVIQLLPDISAHLDHATWAWSTERTLWAPERQLLSFENRNDVATPGDGIGRADREDLDRLRHTLTLSRSLTTALAADLDAALVPSQRGGHTRLPHMGDKLATATRESRYLSIHAQSAHDALRRAHALNAREFAVPTPLKEPRSPRPYRTLPAV
jgi:hypothetical protein